MQKNVYLNRIATAVPPHECHTEFVSRIDEFSTDMEECRKLSAIAPKLGITKRYTALSQLFDTQDTSGFYSADRNPTTSDRMNCYQKLAPALAGLALEPLLQTEDRNSITHLVITTCTGFYAPGIDIDIIQKFSLSPSVKRTLIGFMGCYAAVPALRTAYDIVRSDSTSRVLVVNLELCSLHFRRGAAFDQLVTFLLFADGCAASLVSAEPRGLKLDSFASTLVPETLDHMRWTIGDDGFFMRLDPRVPEVLAGMLRENHHRFLDGRGVGDFSSWAIHPGGRGILDAVERELNLPPDALAFSRRILNDYGNMSSATIMFVLQQILEHGDIRGSGCAMAFGPGLTLESFLYEHMGRS